MTNHYYNIQTADKRIVVCPYGAIFEMCLSIKGRLKYRVYFSNWACFEPLVEEFLKTAEINNKHKRFFVEVV